MNKKKKAARPKAEGKQKRSKVGKVVAKAANGAPVPTIAPAPKTGPNLSLRARSQSQIDRIKRAAKAEGLSMNTWAVEVLDRAVEAALG